MRKDPRAERPAIVRDRGANADVDKRPRDRIPTAVEQDMEGGDEADPEGGEKRKPGADPAPVLAKRHHGAVPLGNEEL